MTILPPSFDTDEFQVETIEVVATMFQVRVDSMIYNEYSTVGEANRVAAELRYRVRGEVLILPSLVKFTNPMSAEESAERFTIVELRGNRVLVELVCDDTIAPTFVYPMADLIPA